MIRTQLCFAWLAALLCSGCSQQTDSTGDRFWGHRFSQAHDVRYGAGEDQRMDIYSQGTWVGEPNYWRGDSLKHPTLVYIHGGGWLSNTKDQITPFILPYLEKGFNVVTLEYGKGAGTAPLAVDDCMHALQWINRHADDYNIDRKKIVLSGESAGGHLAMITGMLNTIPASHPGYCGDSLKVAAIVNWFGICDIAGIDRFYCDKGEPKNYAAIWVGAKSRMDSISRTYSPVHRITATTPPLITIHGKKDSVVPFMQAETLHGKLKIAGVKNELVSFDKGKHLGFSDAEFTQAYARIFKFLRTSQ
jgi:acetyl esterase/lipase